MQINILRARRYWKSTGLIFIHIPKNGGTSINHAIYGRSLGHFTFSEIELFNSRCLEKVPTLAISRNPWARLFSAYKFSKYGGNNIDGPKIYNPSFYKNKVFDSFETFIFEWLVFQDIKALDLIFRPQIDFIKNRNGVVDIDHIGKLENHKSYADWITKRLGFSFEPMHLNMTGTSISYRDAYSSEMSNVVASIYKQDIDFFKYDF